MVIRAMGFVLSMKESVMRTHRQKRVQKRVLDFLYWYWQRGNSVRTAWLLARITL